MNNYKVFTGIDQSKKDFHVCLIIPGNNQQCFHQKFTNDTKGVDQLIAWINLKTNVELDQVLFCVENTGPYCWPLCAQLTKVKAHLWMESALRIKLSSGLKRGKSDPADAKDIAFYAMHHQSRVRLFTMPDKALLVLQQVLSFRERLVKQKTALKAPCKDLSDLNFDLSGFISEHSQHILELIEEKIKLCDQKLMKIIRREKVLKSQFELICSVHGVGKQTALFILIYTKAFTSFNNPKQFACYCGVAPFKYASGTSIRGKTRVSHMANKKLKSLLTMCALNTIKKPNELKEYYDRKTQEGKNPMLVINAIRNKLIARVFAVVKRGTPYQPKIAA